MDVNSGWKAEEVNVGQIDQYEAMERDAPTLFARGSNFDGEVCAVDPEGKPTPAHYHLGILVNIVTPQGDERICKLIIPAPMMMAWLAAVVDNLE